MSKFAIGDIIIGKSRPDNDYHITGPGVTCIVLSYLPKGDLRGDIRVMHFEGGDQCQPGTSNYPGPDGWTVESSQFERISDVLIKAANPAEPCLSYPPGSRASEELYLAILSLTESVKELTEELRAGKLKRKAKPKRKKSK